MTGADRRYAQDGATMVFSEYPYSGPGASPRTFVAAHGIGMGRITFDGVSEHLAPHGRVLAVDLPGFGDSPEPDSAGANRAATLEETAEFVAGFIRSEAGGPTVLIGHSMGTQIVAEIALHHPDLVEALVLIAPTVNRHERTAARQAARMVQDLQGEGAKVILLGMWEYAKTNPAWFLRKLRFMLGHRLERICPRITRRALVLRGETDRVCPRDWVSEVAAAIPDAVMREIPGRGHEAIIKSPEPVASMILDFIGAPRAVRRILHVVTNVDRYGETEHPTGLWLSELAHAWAVFAEQGFEQAIVSPVGGASPLEPRSLRFPNSDGASEAWLTDPAKQALLEHTLSPDEVEPADYDAIYYTGGHAVMYDFPDSEGLQRIAREVFERGGIVSSVCHGYCGLLNVRLSDGSLLLDGRRMTGFSWREERLARVAGLVPYNAEDEARGRGARYEQARLPFVPFVSVDGRLITGQNPRSATETARAVVAALAEDTGSAEDMAERPRTAV